MQEHEKARYLVRLRSFLAAHPEHSETAKGKTPSRLLVRYLANKWALQGMDLALRGMINIGLEAFLDDRPPRKLLHHERRFFINVADAEAYLQNASFGRIERACIEDTLTGETWQETRPELRRRILLHFLDMGSSAWQKEYALWCSPHSGLWGWMWPDDSHRRHNNFIDALTEAKLGWLRHEALVVSSSGTAPWGGCGHFGKIEDLYNELAANDGWRDEGFVAAYPQMVFDVYGGKAHAAAGTDQDVEEMFERMGSSDLIAKKGLKAVANRWCWRKCMHA